MTASIHNLQEKICAWLGEQLAEKEHRSAKSFELQHGRTGSQPEIIKDWHLDSNPELFTKPEYRDQWASDIVEFAEDRAATYSHMGDNHFVLRVHRIGGGRLAFSFQILAAMPTNSSDGSAMLIGNAPVAPNAMGLLELQIRNNQFVMQTNKEMTAGSVSVLLAQLGDYREENKALRDENAKLRAEINAGKAAEMEHELRVVKQANAEARKDKIVDKAVSLLPLAAAKLLPERAGSGTALGAVVAQLGDTITPDQLRVIASALSMEQRALFVEAIKMAKTSQGAKPDSNHVPVDSNKDSSPPVNGVASK